MQKSAIVAQRDAVLQRRTSFIARLHQLEEELAEMKANVAFASGQADVLTGVAASLPDDPAPVQAESPETRNT